MIRSLKVQVEKLETGEYLVTSKDLPALLAQGRTLAEALEIAADVTRKLYEIYRERNETIPAMLEILDLPADLVITMDLPA